MTRSSGPKPNKSVPQPQLNPNDILPWLPADDPIFHSGFVFGERRGGPRPKPAPTSGTTPKGIGSDDD
jgi:hypothetical protein